VAASKDADFDSLPRWMKTQHFADLKAEAQWRVFTADPRRQYQTPRVPYMAANLPKDFVTRPEEFEPIVTLLLSQERQQRKPVGVTTAPRGAADSARRRSPRPSAMTSAFRKPSTTASCG